MLNADAWSFPLYNCTLALGTSCNDHALSAVDAMTQSRPEQGEANQLAALYPNPTAHGVTSCCSVSQSHRTHSLIVGGGGAGLGRRRWR